MSKNIEHLQHIKSNVVNNGMPKLPTAEVLVDGELAVNYAEGYETISLRNSNSGITTFSSDDYYTKKKLGSGFTSNDVTVTDAIEELEEVVSSSLNDLEERKLDASAYTPTDLSNYYTKSETSGATEISNALGAKVNSQTFISHTADTNAHVTSEEKVLWNAKADKSWVEEKLGSGFTSDNSANTITSVIEELEEVVSFSLNDLESKKLDASAYTPTDLSNYYTKSETSGATEINTALSNKVDKTEYAAFSAATNISIEDLSGQSETVAAALNDLNTNKADKSTTYTKSEIDDMIGDIETLLAAI